MSTKRIITASKNTSGRQDKEGFAKPLPPLGGTEASPDLPPGMSIQMINKIKKLTKGPGTDEAKLKRLQTLIANGEYKVDAKAVAERLIDCHLKAPD